MPGMRTTAPPVKEYAESASVACPPARRLSAAATFPVQKRLQLSSLSSTRGLGRHSKWLCGFGSPETLDSYETPDPLQPPKPQNN
eukprot:4655257-Amphidinium_carterae.1